MRRSPERSQRGPASALSFEDKKPVAETSIVVPTPGGGFLRCTVASVVAQTVSNWELVIVDDGSTDGTAEIAATLAADDARIRIVTQKQAGIANARNRGLSEISPGSAYVALLDHDDLWMPDTLELLRAALTARPAASGAHGVATSIDAEGHPLRFVDRVGLPDRLGMIEGRVCPWPLDRPTEFANFAYDDCVTSVGSGLIRRTVLDRMGGFDERAEPADDYDLWVRLSRHGEIVFINRIVLAYRVHEGQRSLRTAPRRGHGIAYVRHKLVTSPENTPGQRRVAIEGFRAHQRKQLRERWSNLVASCQRGECRAAPRQVGALVAWLVAYARGRPSLSQR